MAITDITDITDFATSRRSPDERRDDAPPTGNPSDVGPGQAITVWFDRARPADVDALHRFYERLAPESRRRRFFRPMPRVPRSIAAHSCTVDPARHLVWLAREGSARGLVIGEVQVAVDPEDPARAELALAVEDRWAGRGLGRTLVGIAHELAASLGVETLTADVLGDNRRSADLLARAGMRFTVASGVLEGTGPVVRSGPIPVSAVFTAPAVPRVASVPEDRSRVA